MKIGEYQELTVGRETPHGFYLTDGSEEVLLPGSQMPEAARLGDRLSVFVYTDSEDRPIATMKRPKATVGEFAFLKVVAASRAGAFLDWGLDKDLFCPVAEQQPLMKPDYSYLVRLYLDERSQRVVCSGRWFKFVTPEGTRFKPGDKVQIIVAERSADLISVIIDGRVRASLFPDEWVENLRVGDLRTAFIKAIRPEDLRVAVSLRPQGYKAVVDESSRILDELRAAGGFLPYSDKSSPEEIQSRFGLSKGSFKKLIGTLYRQEQIRIEDGGIRLIKPI